jgi:hypothetical protein
MKRPSILIHLGMPALLGGLTALAQAPSFIRAPADGAGTELEPFVLSATVAGAAPLSVQWAKGGFALPGATNLSLIFTNLFSANTGNYTLTVSNSVGAISANVTLVVLTTPARRVYTGTVSTNGNLVSVPVRFVPNGIESGLQFSVGFDTNVLSQPAFEFALPAATLTRPTVSDAGDSVGVTLRFPDGAKFEPTDTLVGAFRFVLADGKSPWDAGLRFSPVPVAPAGLTSTNSLGLVTNGFPFLQRVDALPVLDRQTGLFLQRLRLVNPTATEFTNTSSVNLLVLGLNPATNTVFNAVANQRTDTDLDGDLDLDLGVDCVNPATGEACDDCCTLNPDVNGDGLADPVPLLSIVGLKAGEARDLVLEIFSKSRTQPQPRFSIQLGTAVTNAVSLRSWQIPVLTNGIVGGKVMLAFRTTTTNRYYIQYTDAAGDFAATNHVRVAQPPVTGNGSWIQWIDQGPPKTEPLLTNTTRFYRVLAGF